MRGELLGDVVSETLTIRVARINGGYPARLVSALFSGPCQEKKPLSNHRAPAQAEDSMPFAPGSEGVVQER